MKKKSCIKLASILIFTLVMMEIMPKKVYVSAADPFPFDYYTGEGKLLYVTDSPHPDYLSIPDRVKDGFIDVAILTCEGYENGENTRNQEAILRLKIPDGYKDYLEKNDIDPGYGYSCEETKTFQKDIYYDDADKSLYNNYVWNTGWMKLSYYIGSGYFTRLHDSNDMEGEINNYVKNADIRFADRWGENWKNENTDGIEPFRIERGENGSACIIYHRHKTERTDISTEVVGHGEVNGFSDDISDEIEYICLNVVPETDKYCYITFSMDGRVHTTIYEPSDTDYVPIYESYKQREKEFINLDFGRQMALNPDLLTVEWQEPEIINLDMTSEEEGEEINETTPEPEEPISVKHTRRAKKEEGEDSGALIPVIVVVGTLAAAGGTALALKKKKKKGDEKENKKSYMMYINKAFGDTIPKGSRNIKVGARIAEIDTSGKAIDRNDLTSEITAAGNGMVVNRLSFDGRYMEAYLEVPKDYFSDKASVTFTFTGEGGTFSNTVEFKITNGVSLKFIDEIPVNGMATPLESEYEIDAIKGDRLTYEATFMLIDAVKPAKLSDITAGKTDCFEVGFEETGYQNVFKVVIKNRTDADEPDIFAESVKKGFDINVKIEDQDEPASGYIEFTLYPEGLSISSRQAGEKDGVKYVGVQAYEKAYVGDLDNKWQVSEISFTLAVKNKEKVIIDPEGTKYTFEKLKGAGGLGGSVSSEDSLAKKYEYKEETGMLGSKFTYTFEPNAHLCEPEDGTFLMVLLPVNCTYAGSKYTTDIPIRLLGKVPDPYEGWDEEYKKLKERIEKYSLPEDRQKWEDKLDELVLDPKSSTAQLRLTSKIIVRNYMRYWLIEGVDARNDAELYDKIINQLEWLKFFGDCAFSILVSMYAGPVAEAIISPAKDFATEAIGELIAAWNHGEKIDASIINRFEFAQNLSAAGDNLVSNNIKLTNWRQAAATLGAYLVYSSIKNYIKKLNDTGESDLYGALVNGFTDMTAQAFKAYASKMFEMWMKNSKTFKEKIGPWITKYFKETKFNNLQMQYNNWQQLHGDLALKEAAVVTMELTEVLNKYLTELVGLASSKAQEILDDNTHTSSGFGISETGHITFTFTMQAFMSRNYQVVLDLNAILMNLSCPFFGWLYNLIFDQVPVAASVKQPPKDPPLPPDNK